MVVSVDQARDYGLAGQVHLDGTLRGLPFTLTADPGEAVTLDEKRGVLDGYVAVADDEARAREPDRVRGRLRWSALRRTCRGQDQKKTVWHHPEL